MELFVETHVRSQTTKRGCSSSWTTVLSTSWHVRSIILFCKLLFSWIQYDDFFFKIFKRPIIVGWGRDMGTILRPIQISIQICGWRWDRLVDLTKIRSMGSPTLRPKTCDRPVVSNCWELSISIEHPVWGVRGLEKTIWTTLDELWSTRSNGHRD